MDTIFALASAPGKAGVSIIRISGPDARSVVAKMGARLEPHDRKLVTLLDRDGVLIDQAFALSFSEGRSFTGEEVVELHTHGSPSIVAAVQDHLSELGLRLADPGEFTRRAMENGRLDLAQVEGLADLIDAETESQRRQAVRVFSGELGTLAEKWRKNLIRAVALLEATIDFADEEVPEDVYPEVNALITSVSAEVVSEAEGVAVRERIRDGFEIALVGPPNSGKSTLLNRLAGREAAITSDIAGTTRDVIEVRMDVDGFPVTFLDTAGIRESDDQLEALGIQHGRRRASRADMRIHLVEPDEMPDQTSDSDLFVISKSDLRPTIDRLSVSGIDGTGIDALLNRISNFLADQVADAGVATRLRHEKALVAARVHLSEVQAMLQSSADEVDILAEELHTAIRCLDSLIGRVDVENVLDEIFLSFCIGK
ncbi:tRNA uridine-5-carboxymethylaminomethyl(34) synthesis GTPase MnmE [Thalassorhabdomicrobium marinisediminis]|uniref:tRNA uridine-5-carboxymethylaminomethyl(34) synthesis GTPase MnmE n=1 Tax=Thalassorhabdomicrobium marinisediminis TaxID=2170577 RepID=UPI00248F8025|nr:tRNA uridine-5-carboxymethylaminomethyl(34) synthesis GTPase MnmE [Thalassorhabdomicrobium marinisediminis]